ncbi:serine / threonine-protein kinase [Sclerotinia borealis F-4128]|uniref:Serine / threonine-protein kinase n=1 Tax=Sclerotinia borealis (strain F-4128) TaxID=1432307 RepID=W9CUE6_SCLBF|nr:serine / threonine-protein kinase [Sclerotinia borealis F-4128]
MSSLSQAIKNALHRGKGGAKANEDTSKKSSPAPPTVAQHYATRSDPNVMAHQAHQVPGGDAYSVANEDGRHRGARAANAAAHAAAENQRIGQSRVDQEALAKLLAEENENKNRLPLYPGLERWQLIEKMGDGAFSNVYKARDKEGKIGEVAIKVVRKFEMNSNQGDAHLHPKFNKKQPKGVERANILKEVSIMRNLDHPNIIKLIEFSESKQYYYLVLELAPGGELFHQIVAEALHYLHETQGVVHRDIKPENILFEPIPVVPTRVPKPRSSEDEDKVDEGEFIHGVGSGGIGRIKIADFGLSKVVWDSQTMTPCGTVGYTAPEIVKDERYSKSVDMWALGCVLYTLLCGFPPFYDESIQVLTEKVARGQYTFLSPWWDEISKSAQDLVSHLLTVDPVKRYTIEQFLQHPWIRGIDQPTYAALDAPPLATPAVERQRQLGVPLRAFNDLMESPGAGRRMDFRSPGAVNLREVFDVGYAVHRQEEEAKRKKNFKQGYRGAAGINALNPIDDDEDDEAGEDTEASDDDSLDENGVSSKVPRSGQSDVAQVDEALRNTRLNANSAAPARGYGQHSASVTAAARQQVGRRSGAFELNLDGATLIGRRHKKAPPSNLRDSSVLD